MRVPAVDLIRWARPAALLLGLLCFVPALSAGFYGDDFVLLSTLEGSAPSTANPANLYLYSTGKPAEVATLVQGGAFPWWTHPGFKVALWRPLTSVLLRLDHAAFGLRPLGYHAHSLLWFLGLVGVVGALYRRLFPGAVAALAVLVFAVDESHWLISSWVSNRHAIISAVAGFLGLLMHLRWREQGYRPGLPLSLAAFAIGLAAGESGLQSFAFVAAYELVGARGGAGQRVRALMPALGLAVGYLVLYKLSGFGARNAGAYIDPIGETSRFLGRALIIAPSMLAELLGGTEVLYALHRPVPVIRVLLTFAVLGGGGALLWRALRALPEAERRTTCWFLLGGLLALVPPIASQRDPYGTSRSVLFSSVTSALAIAVVLRHVFLRAREAAGRARWTATSILALLTLSRFVLDPIATFISSWELARIGEQMVVSARAVDADGPPGTEVVLLSAADYLTGYGPLMRSVDQRQPLRPWWNVSWSPLEQEVRRIAPNAFELSVPTGALLTHDFERFYRADPRPLTIGQTFDTRLMRVKIVDRNAEGPSRIEVVFDRSLDDPSLHFLAYSGGALRRVSMPPLGGRLLLSAIAP